MPGKRKRVSGSMKKAFKTPTKKAPKKSKSMFDSLFGNRMAKLSAGSKPKKKS